MSFDVFALLLIGLFFIAKFAFWGFLIWSAIYWIAYDLKKLAKAFTPRPTVININITQPQPQPQHKVPYSLYTPGGLFYHAPQLDPERANEPDFGRPDPPRLQELPRLEPPTIDHVPYDPPPKLR
jgi:hypothetical protein